MIAAMLRWSLVLLVAACGTKTTTPTNPDHPPLGSGSALTQTGDPVAAPIDAPVPFDQDYPRIVDQEIAMYTELHGKLAALSDCPAATTAVDGVQAKYADVITAIHTITRENRIEPLRAALRVREAEFSAIAKAVMELPVLPACARDAAFTRAFGRFTGV
jgi:hypothetical protein